MCQYTSAPEFRTAFLPGTDFRLAAELSVWASQPPPLNSTNSVAWWMQFERHPYTPPGATPWAAFSDGTTSIPVIAGSTLKSMLNPCTPVNRFPTWSEDVVRRSATGSTVKTGTRGGRTRSKRRARGRRKKS
jgi:hypothetical protein